MPWSISTILIKCVLLTITAKCVLADGVLSFRKFDQNTINENNGIVCLDNRTKCTQEQTCCVTKHNSYHCCRYANAVCCPDKYHCCPNGTTCDCEKKQCIRNLEDPMEWPVVENTEKLQKKMMELKPSFKLRVFQQNSESLKISTKLTCPNNKTKCKDTKTCCITKHKNYYCCPYKNAVCCSDKYHCCPEKTTCYLGKKKCVNSSISTHIHNRFTAINEPFYLKPASTNIYSLLLEVNKIEKKCQNSQCKCCEMEGRKLGCCKFNKGVCCPDMKTCCPPNTECDTKNNKCVKDLTNLIPLIEETGKEIQTKSSEICPNKIMKCKSSETCCSVGNGLYGCCSFPNATCCSDYISCCKHNEICDLKTKMCIPKDKIQSFIVERKSLISFYSAIGLESSCPDKSNCNDQDTCCPTKDKKYACCPYKDGVCCPDEKTCCPDGYQCVLDGCTKDLI